MSLNWRGDQVVRNVRAATKWGIDKTMSEVVIHSRRNHPGWTNITGNAEGSVRIIRPAQDASGAIIGIWGSVGVLYVIYLEFKSGSFLRTAGDAIYPRLVKHIRSKIK